MDKLITYHVLISGIVQGVGYRYATQKAAIQLGARGWVRNLPDGRVEAMFTADQSTLNTMVDWCHCGSPHAIVDHVEVCTVPDRDFQGFQILP